MYTKANHKNAANNLDINNPPNTNRMQSKDWIRKKKHQSDQNHRKEEDVGHITL